jgi:hypothetical protein
MLAALLDPSYLDLLKYLNELSTEAARQKKACVSMWAAG